MFVIDEELKKLPDSPGVYLMHAKDDEIIYIGKAKILKNRVRQYFQSGRNKSSKILKMVENISYFEYIVTDSELEALILECNLIKKHSPKYNTMLKDDKGYPYIKVTVNEEYPRVVFAREMKKDKNRYFGPYKSASSVKDTIELLQKIYKLRSCNKNLPRDIGKGRPCLNYHIKQCNAPCMGYISKEDYNVGIEGVLNFLNGKYTELIKSLEEKMYKASEQMQFEEAASYRDLLFSVKEIVERQKITNDDFVDRDIIAYAAEGNDAVVQVFYVRNGKLIGREHFYMKLSPHDSGNDILSSFIKQYYSGTPNLPKELFLSEEIEDVELFEEWLTIKRGNKVKVFVPKKGQKEKLVLLAAKNARLVLLQDKEKVKRQAERTIEAAAGLFKMLGIESKNDYRVEAFDISNTAGYQSVGSMTVHENGKPKRNDYRKFKIKTITGPDDYGSMREVLTRRFSHGLKELEEGLELGSFNRFPDLIMMDGGKGQVNVALQVLEELGIDVAVCGMVKDDNHRTRGLYFKNRELPLDTGSEIFKLITRIQDETHRFAIEYHRSLRGKQQIKSVLDDIKGIGAKRRIALMRHFKSIDLIRQAEISELATVESMNEEAARNVYEFFRK